MPQFPQTIALEGWPTYFPKLPQKFKKKRLFLYQHILFLHNSLWFAILGNGSAALLGLIYGPMHFQGLVQDEQFKCQG